MSRELNPEIKPAPPLSIALLEKGDSFLAYCNTCQKVICKGGGKTRISRRVIEDQIESHIAAFYLPHTIDVLSTGL